MSSQFNTGGFAGTTQQQNRGAVPTMSVPTGPVSDVDYSQNYSPQQNAPNTTATGAPIPPDTPQKKPSVFSAQRYSRLCDTNEKMIAKRFAKSILFCGGAFYGADQSDPDNRPDLYGPFWTVATLVLVLCILGSVQQNQGTLDITKASYAATTFFCGLFIPPFILYWFLRWFRAKRSLSNVISLYGYSFFIYIPMALCTLIPIPHIGIICVSIATGCSTLFLVKNVYCYFLQQQKDLYATYHQQHDSETAGIEISRNASPVEQPNVDSTGHVEEKPNKIVGLVLMIGVIAIHCLIGFLSYLFFFHPSEVEPTPEPTPTPPSNDTNTTTPDNGTLPPAYIQSLFATQPTTTTFSDQKKTNLHQLFGL